MGEPSELPATGGGRPETPESPQEALGSLPPPSELSAPPEAAQGAEGGDGPVGGDVDEAGGGGAVPSPLQATAAAQGEGGGDPADSDPGAVGGLTDPTLGAQRSAPGGGGVASLLGSPPVVLTPAGGVALAERSGVDAFRRASRSANTLAAYRSDWSHFTAWCERNEVAALPAEPATVAAYLADAAQETSETGRSAPWRYAPATLARWVATINAAHDLAGARPPGRDPAVAETLAGIRRLRASPPARKAPILLPDLERIVAGVEVSTWPAAPGGLRNRALLVLGWVGAFRRSELAVLTVADITPHPEDGLHVLVRQSKTDPEAHGQILALPYARNPLLCAPCAWARWRAVLDAWEGSDGGPGRRAGVMRATRNLELDHHLCRQRTTAGTDSSVGAANAASAAFRAVRANGTLGGPINGQVINEVIKATASAAGFEPDRIGGHSLRAGFVTQAFRTGADAHAVMRQTRHRDPKTLEIYAREGAPLVGNAVMRVGL